MNKFVELNQPALWRPIRNDGLSVKKCAMGYPYYENGITKYADKKTTVTRYAKNFTKFNLDFSLFMFSNETDEGKIGAYFESISKELKKKQIAETLVTASMTNFLYLPNKYGDK